MQDEQKTKAELLQDLDTLRRHISELEQTEQRLKDSEKQFKELFENTPVGIYRATPDGRIIMANPALIRATALPAITKCTMSKFVAYVQWYLPLGENVTIFFNGRLAEESSLLGPLLVIYAIVA